MTTTLPTNSRVATDPQTPTYSVEVITPEIAQKILTSNTHNRNLRPRLVTGYAADMAAGTWVENGETMKIADDGTVIDGQHRLHAIVESSTTQRMLVVRGLPIDAQDTVDNNARRTFADVLKLRSEPNSVAVSSVTRQITMWENGWRRIDSMSYAITNAQLLATLETYPDIRYSAEVARSVVNHLRIPVSILGLCHWLFVRIDPDDCEFFFGRLGDGAALSPKDPVAVLRRTIIDSANGRDRLSTRLAAAFVIKAWNAYREGREITLLKFRPGGAKPEQFPEPI